MGDGWWWVDLTMVMTSVDCDFGDRARETPHPSPSPISSRGTSSAICGTRGPICVLGVLASRQAAASFLMWEGPRRAASRLQAWHNLPVVVRRVEGRLGARPPVLRPPLPSTLIALPCSPPAAPAGFCSHSSSLLDNHHPWFAAESFLALPRPTQGMPLFLILEGSCGQKAGGRDTCEGNQVVLHCTLENTPTGS